MEDRILEHYLDEFIDEADIDTAEAETLFEALIGSDDQELLTNVLLAWNNKGISDDEIFEFASILRRRMRRVQTRHEVYADIVGTGGSGSKTFNVSTAAAFVIAGAGVPVAKHGNKAATSTSGSADVLTELGVSLETSAEHASQVLDELGVCFMFAPMFHSLSPTLAAARRAVGGPTIFNILGPLCNPASAPFQMIGAWDPAVAESMSKVIQRLGTSRTWVVHSDRGLDEIDLRGETAVFAVEDDEVSQIDISPASFGVLPATGDLPNGCSAAESADLIRNVFTNKLEGTPTEQLVVLNSAAVIYLAGRAASLPEAAGMANESIRSGAAMKKLTQLAEASR
jgi:anthranilate phosphoribosyltransferase